MIEAWSNKDARILGKFLQSDTGKKLVQGFKETEPDLDATSIEARALQAAEFSQWRKDKTFIQNALQLQTEPADEDHGINVEGLDVVE